MPTSMPGLWNSIRALMFCLQTALPPPPAPEGIPLPLVFSTQPFLPLLSSPFLPLPSMAIRWCSGRFPGFLSPTSGHTTNHKTEMLWAIQPTDMLWAIQRTGMLWAIQPTGMLWAIQPTEALGYPAHRNALGYPAHRSFGLSSPQKCFGLSSPQKLWAIQPTEMLWAIQPTEMLWAIQLTEMFWDIQPTEMLWAIQPTEIYIQHTLPCASTHLIFLCTCPPTCSASSPCRPSPHPQSCHFPASSSDLLPTSCCAPGCYSSLARSADLL